LRYIKHILRLLFISATCLLLLEVGLRYSYSLSIESETWIKDPDIGFRLRPHHKYRGYRKLDRFKNTLSNSKGYNDTEHSPVKNQGSVRVAIIGDSFVWGVVEPARNVIGQLSEIAKTHGRDVEFLNFGMPAIGPREYLSILKRDVAEMSPDIVLVMIFVGNDILDYTNPDFERRLWLGTPYKVLKSPYLVGSSPEYSSVYRFLRFLERVFWDVIDSSPDGTFSEKTFLDMTNTMSKKYHKNLNPELIEAYNVTNYIISEMAKWAKENQTKFVLILAPDELQVSTDLRDSFAKTYDVDLANFDFQTPQRIFTEYADVAGIAVVDLLPLFLTESASRNLYFKQDTHWNEAGNRLAAEEAWRFLIDPVHGLLSQSTPH